MSDHLHQLLSEIQQRRQQAADLANAIEQSMAPAAATEDSPPASLLEDMTEEFVETYQPPHHTSRICKILRPKNPRAAPASPVSDSHHYQQPPSRATRASIPATPSGEIVSGANAETWPAQSAAADTAHNCAKSLATKGASGGGWELEAETTWKPEMRHFQASLPQGDGEHAIIGDDALGRAKINYAARAVLWDRVRNGASTDTGSGGQHRREIMQCNGELSVDHAGNSSPSTTDANWKWSTSGEWIQWASYIHSASTHSIVENLSFVHTLGLPPNVAMGGYSDQMLESGKIVREYSHGKVQLHAYVDGNVKRQVGDMVTVFLANGDWQWEGGEAMCYYYAEQQVWQRRDEVEEEFRFSDGSIEWSERAARNAGPLS